MAVSRLVSRSFVRKLSHTPFGENKAEAGKNAAMWKKIFFFVAVPCCVLAHINVYLKTKEEEEHFERPPFVPYECVRIRTKRFPWGDGTKSLFHNPHVNALPTGYEDAH